MGFNRAMQIYTSWGPGPLLAGYVDAEAESSRSCVLVMWSNLAQD